MTSALIRELITALEETFQGIPRPHRTRSVARAMSETWVMTDERLGELQQKDPETNWRELTDAALEEFAGILPALDPPAFQFYYPAFLHYTVRHWYGVHNQVHAETMEVLWWQPDLIQSLSAAGAELVMTILEKLAATDEAQDYLIPTTASLMEALGEPAVV